MEFIEIATEQTTAVTDAIMAIMSIVAALQLRKIGASNRWKSNLWVCAFALLTTAGVLGAIAHGFKISDDLRSFLWQPLYLSLGLLVSLFTVAAAYDIFGKNAASRLLPIMIVVGVVFFGVTLVLPDSFLVFIAYEVSAMLFALFGYVVVASRGKLEGAWLMVLGVLVTVIAAGVQATKALSFTFIWSFDHNGVYHLIQMAGIVLLVAGLRKAFPSRN